MSGLSAVSGQTPLWGEEGFRSSRGPGHRRAGLCLCGRGEAGSTGPSQRQGLLRATGPAEPTQERFPGPSPILHQRSSNQLCSVILVLMLSPATPAEPGPSARRPCRWPRRSWPLQPLSLDASTPASANMSKGKSQHRSTGQRAVVS